MKTTPAWIGWTYVAYSAVVMFFALGCPMYAVFVLGHNPWWLLLVGTWTLAYAPWRWVGLLDGVERPLTPKDNPEDKAKRYCLNGGWQS